MTEYQGWTHKFTILEANPVDCYLKIGVVSCDHWDSFPHLSIGDICYLDLTVSKQMDELRIYEVLFELANKLIECGGTIRHVCEVLRGQKIFPCGPTNSKEVHMCSSIVDYVAKYLENKR